MSEDIAGRQAIVDAEHLRLVSIAHVVSGGISLCVSMFAAIYIVMGLGLATALGNVPHRHGEPSPAIVGGIMAGFGIAFFLFMVGASALKFLVALRVSQRRWRGFCLAVAGVECLGIPWGTLIGVCTIMVLTRDSVTRQFETQSGA